MAKLVLYGVMTGQLKRLAERSEALRILGLNGDIKNEEYMEAKDDLRDLLVEWSAMSTKEAILEELEEAEALQDRVDDLMDRMRESDRELERSEHWFDGMGEEVFTKATVAKVEDVKVEGKDVKHVQIKVEVASDTKEKTAGDTQYAAPV